MGRSAPASPGSYSDQSLADLGTLARIPDSKRAGIRPIGIPAVQRLRGLPRAWPKVQLTVLLKGNKIKLTR
jgi:hypothetical protein